MKPPRDMNPLRFEQHRDSPENRRHGRVHCDHITCSLGQVRDLSASGMKIFRKGKMVFPHEPIEVTLKFMADRLTVFARLVRSKKIGFRKHLYGFEFVDLTETQRRELTNMARVGAGRLLLVHEEDDE